MIPYGRGHDGEQLFKRYAARDVVYLVGAKDNNPHHRRSTNPAAPPCKGRTGWTGSATTCATNSSWRKSGKPP
jgi:hypothetical protein